MRDRSARHTQGVGEEHDTGRGSDQVLDQHNLAARDLTAFDLSAGAVALGLRADIDQRKGKSVRHQSGEGHASRDATGDHLSTSFGHVCRKRVGDLRPGLGMAEDEPAIDIDRREQTRGETEGRLRADQKGAGIKQRARSDLRSIVAHDFTE